MSETVSDSFEPRRIFYPCGRVQYSVCGSNVIYVFLTRFIYRLFKVLMATFECFTCLIAARFRVEVKRVSLIKDLQIKWGGREVSPYYRQRLIKI